MTQRIAIVGGGVTGLAAAYALERHGEAVEVTLLEASARLGGKVRTEQTGDLVIETGPDALFSRTPFAFDMLRELGLAEEIVRANRLQGGPTILRNGRFRPLPPGMETGVPRSIWPMTTTRLLSPLGKLRAASEVLVPPGDLTQDESVDGFVRRRFGAEVAERIAAPLLGGIYSSDTRELSLAATLPHLRTWEQDHRSLLLASMRGRLPGARRASSAAAPSPFISLRSGLSRLVDALGASVPRTQVRLKTRVTGLRLSSRSDGFALDLSTGEHLATDCVILATPAFVTADLVEPLSPAAAVGLRGVRYASATIVALVFGPDAAPQVPDGSGFLVAAGEHSILKACSWSSQKWPHCAPGGEVLVRCHLRGDAESVDDVALTRAIRSELRGLIGLQAEPRLTRVYRWPRSIPSYSVGHLQRIQAIDDALREYPGLVIAGAGMRGVGIPECLRQGVVAAEHVLQGAPTSIAAPAS